MSQIQAGMGEAGCSPFEKRITQAAQTTASPANRCLSMAVNSA
jgi:hypothetical protein